MVINNGFNEQVSNIHIGVLSKVDLNLASIDPYVAMVDAMALNLDSVAIDDQSFIVSAKIAPIFDQQLLRDNKQFTSIIELTVRSFI